MKRSEAITQLATALAVAQGEIEGASKDRANPAFKSKYADLASVWDACRGPLSRAGLCIVQAPSRSEQVVEVETLLLHKSGEWISSELKVQAASLTPQAIGSAITYARRYSLMAIVGIAPEDDDGNSASRRSVDERQSQPPRSEPPHDPETGEVVPSIADKLFERVRAASNIDELSKLGKEIGDAKERGIITPAERETLAAEYGLRRKAVLTPAEKAA
jgi:hypothetical protein